MTDPITPPLELVQQWKRTAPHPFNETEHYHYITLCAAQWGADQQLETCCEQLKSIPSPLGIPFGEMASNALRSACRPKPPSLKERALKLLDGLALPDDAFETIRFALEALPE
jgi:hypothetical protein